MLKTKLFLNYCNGQKQANHNQIIPTLHDIFPEFHLK